MPNLIQEFLEKLLFIKSDTLIITDLKPKSNHDILQGRLTLIDADGLRYGTSALFHRNHRE